MGSSFKYFRFDCSSNQIVDMTGTKLPLPLQQTAYGNFLSDDTYKPAQLLGSGAYGRVFKGTHKDGRVVALKEIVIPADDQGIPLSTLRELTVLKKLQAANSPYLVQMLDISLRRQTDNLCLYIVFEFVDCDLAHYLSHKVPKTGLSVNTIRSLSAQMLKGIDFLHSNRIIHRDIKPANILINEAGTTLKITDFGLSRVLGWESPLTPIVVTLWYRSPEILVQSEYLSPCDVWAAGCIIVEMYNLKAIFSAKTEILVLKKILDTIGFPPDSDWPRLSYLRQKDFKKLGEHNILRSKVKTTDSTALDLIECMLTFNPHKRIPACEALKMPFFSAAPTAAVPDFRNSDLTSSSASTGASRFHLQPRSSLRPVGHNAMARPMMPSRHSLLTVPAPSGPVTRQRRAAAVAAAASSANAIPPPPTSPPPPQVLPRQPARGGRRRYTQPTRLTGCYTIGVTSTATTIPEEEDGVVVGEQCSGAAARGGRQKRTARRRTLMGVEKAKLKALSESRMTAWSVSSSNHIPDARTASSSIEPPQRSPLSKEAAPFCSPPKLAKISSISSTCTTTNSQGVGSPSLMSESKTTSTSSSSSSSQHLQWSNWRETARSIPDSTDPLEDETPPLSADYNIENTAPAGPTPLRLHEKDPIEAGDEATADGIVGSINSLSSIGDVETKTTATSTIVQSQED